MNSKKGFSFIEVLIFCFISVILLTLIMGMLANSREFSRTMGCINNMKNITQSIEQFQGDWNRTPRYLGELYPKYIVNRKVFTCPSDKETIGMSYEKSYIERAFHEIDNNKIFLACHRHQKNKKTVAAYLSYAVDVGETQNVTWSGVKAEYGKIYNGGKFDFADGTEVEILSGSVGLLSSFVDNRDNIYSVIYIPNTQDTEIHIDKPSGSASTFEVVTPAVIAGIEGTKVRLNQKIKTSSFADNLETRVIVEEGGPLSANIRSKNQSFSMNAQDDIFIKIEEPFDYDEDKLFQGLPEWIRELLVRLFKELGLIPRIAKGKNITITLTPAGN